MSSFVIQQTDNRLARTSQDKQTLVLQIIGRPAKFKKSLRRALRHMVVSIYRNILYFAPSLEFSNNQEF